MKRYMKRIVCLLLILCLCVGMMPQLLLKADAVSTTYTPSSAYKATTYYSKLQQVELTGNQRDDIIAVALTQAGYCEGSSSGDYGGTNDGNYLNYTEYNYWYHNNINSGMPVGGTYAHWCATFVSWCAEQARIPTSILQRSTAAGHSSSYFNIYFYAGGSTLNASTDNNYHFKGYNYTPKKGDLFFTRTWSHVGLVVGVNGSYVTTVEGNTNDGGSANGEGVFVRSRLISGLYFGVPAYEDNSVKDYATASCTYYPAHAKITVNSNTPVNTQPRSVSTADNSVNLETAAAGKTYTATGLYLNGEGEYWYRVDTDHSENAYLNAADASYVEQLTSDIALTDYDAPNAHVKGNSYGLSGTIASEYNKLNTATCYVYSGFTPGGSAVTGGSDTVSGNKYILDGSTVDYGTSFGSLSSGNYTYSISAAYTNYYINKSGILASNTGTVKLLDRYFVVIDSAVTQSSCAHSNTTTAVKAATCTAAGTSVTACSKCGLVSETTVAAKGHSYGAWSTVAATCTAAGSKSRTCSACGNVEKQTIAATGHSYTLKTHAATCKSYAVYEYTCGSCGDNYKLRADELASGWIDYLPKGLDASLFNSKTQYRYSDYQTTTSYSASLSGYTLKSSAWEQSGTKTVNYVNSWPSGFSTSSSLYSQYNQKSSKVTASETETAKTTVNSDAVVGYLYYHWCYASSYYSQATSGGSYTTFHAYYSTTAPSNYTCDTSDMSYKTGNTSCCSNSNWFFVTEVYAQKSTSYKKLFTYERWTDFSAWGDTAATASSTRKVETRTAYQLKNAALAEHTWSNGSCTACGTAKPVYDYYMVGFINGANYGCEEDHLNMGEYKFVNGKLTVTFAQDSYVFFKTSGNSKWFLTEEYVTGNTGTFVEGGTEKMLVPGGVTLSFTLVENGDGSLTVSYTRPCSHSYSSAVTTAASCTKAGVKTYTCTKCGDRYTESIPAVGHSYSAGSCTACGAADPNYVAPKADYYLVGYINGANYGCEEDWENPGQYKFVNGKLTATFTTDSYVLVKSGDNVNWYMTDGWLGTDVSSATLYNTQKLTNSDKLYVPGGVEVTFTLTENADGSMKLSYATPAASVVPTIKLNKGSATFEDEVFFSIYSTITNAQDVVFVGLLVSNDDDVVDENDEYIMDYDYTVNESTYVVRSHGIPAKKLGELVYFKVFAKLADGTYAYSRQYQYSPKVYAMDRLANSTNAKLKSLCVAMLNYGAAAQTYFGYNTAELANASLTAEQNAMVAAYNSSMVNGTVTANASKVGEFANTQGYTRRYPAVSFEGAFSITYYMIPKNTPANGVTMYYWTQETYNSVGVLTRANADGVFTMEEASAGTFKGIVEGIAAKEIDKPVYVAGIYENGGVSYATGVLVYSLGQYCVDRNTNSTEANMRDLAAATAVYGYYAKQYFAS